MFSRTSRSGTKRRSSSGSGAASTESRRFLRCAPRRRLGKTELNLQRSDSGRKVRADGVEESDRVAALAVDGSGQQPLPKRVQGRRVEAGAAQDLSPGALLVEERLRAG